MKPPFLILCLVPVLAVPGAARAQEWDPSTAEARLLERGSLAYGTHFAQQLLEKQGLDLDVDRFVAAFRAVAEGREPLIDEEARKETFRDLTDFLNQRPKWEGRQFLAENQSRQGVETTASGLQYRVLTDGDGPKPAAEDRVTVHYTGKLLDGSVFDSSVERGEPATFGLSQVIAGWTEGLQLMPKGAKYRFFIPYDLAYGEAGSPPRIPGYATLIFDVELLGINEG